MTKQIPNYLRLVTDTSLQPTVAKNEDLAPLERVCQTFAHATGWQLEVAPGPAPSTNTGLMWSAPVNPGVGTSPGHIRLLFPQGPEEPDLSLERVCPLADALGQMWGEVLATRHALWQREAELAAGVPTIVRDEDPRAPSLPQRLEAVLRGGAEAIGCQAAALYLLDAATTELKLRSSWGLPQRRLTEAARPLPPALADLEALLGNAVVLVEPSLFEYWKVPERDFRSCVCVPVSSPSMPLGTLWLFCDRVRDFTAAETNIAEVVAGRLAADLERETLVDEAVLARDQSRQIAAAQRLQYEQLPNAAPLVEGWQVAARALHAESLGGTFYDWFGLQGDALSIVAGDMHQTGVEGALTANLLRGAARARGDQRTSAHELLEQANTILWTTSANGTSAGLLHAIIDPASQAVEFCAAGPLRLLTIAGDDFNVVAGPAAPLGGEDSVRLATSHLPLRPGELLLAYGTSFLEADEEVLAAFDQRLALALQPALSRPAEELADLAAEVLQTYFTPERTDRVVMLVKRRQK